jgi:hypothetical protein
MYVSISLCDKILLAYSEITSGIARILHLRLNTFGAFSDYDGILLVYPRIRLNIFGVISIYAQKNKNTQKRSYVFESSWLL